MLLGRAVSGPLEANPDFKLMTGYTYSGHPAACAAGIANIELIESEGLVDRAQSVGSGMRERLERLHNRGRIESVRGVGAI